MIKYIISASILGISIVGIFMFANPIYKEITALKLVSASYNEALDNSKSLESERDKLTMKYNSITPENLVKIQKLLPDNVDNIRLILEIEKLAIPYGMALKGVKYSPVKKDTSSTAAGVVPGIAQNAGVPAPVEEYGSWDLEFTTKGTYSNFINFTKDLERNLRIVDIFSVQFVASPDNILKNPGPETY